MKPSALIPLKYIFIGVGLLFLTVLYILRSKKRRRPSLLKLKNLKRLDESEKSIFNKQWKAAKTLNVIVEFGGESRDAFEVLGVPAGSSIEAVTQAYFNKKKDKTLSVAAKILVEKSYKAIKQTNKNEQAKGE